MSAVTPEVGSRVTVLDDSAPIIRTLARLKLRLLRNTIFGARKRAIWSKIVVIAMIGGSIVSAIAIARSGFHNDSKSYEHLLLMLTGMFGLWVFGPLLVGGVDDSLDPARLTLLPLRRRDLRSGLVVGALLGPLPFGTMITLVGVSIGYSASGIGTAITVVAAVTSLLVNLTFARTLAVMLAFAGRSRRGKDLAILLASLGGAAVFLGTQSLRFLSDSEKARILRLFRWLPSGQATQAFIEARDGAIAAPLARLGVLLLLAAFACAFWLRGIDRLLVDPDAIRHERVKRSTDVTALIPRMLRSLTNRPTVVLASKELRYLARSPQRRSSLIVSIVLGAVFALLQSLRFATSNPDAVYGAIVAALFGVHATNNVLGTDAASLWIEQTAGARLKDQLLARSAAASPNLYIPVVLAGFVLAVLSGGWTEFAILVVGSAALIGVPLGVGSIVSVIAPFGQPDHSNPYSNRRAATGNGGLVSLFAVIGIVAIIVVSAIPMAAIVAGMVLLGVPGFALGIAFTAGYSVLCWWLGAKIALRIVRGRETELLASIGGRQASF